MSDQFNNTKKTIMQSAVDLFLVDALIDDNNDLPFVTRGISFATEGDLEVLLAESETAITIPSGALSAGIIHPLRVRRVLTGTTATDIVGYV